jgi:hypothetical protein
MDGLIEHLFNSRRTMEKAFGDMLVKYQREPSLQLAETIELMQAEIELRVTAPTGDKLRGAKDRGKVDELTAMPARRPPPTLRADAQQP